ncbi:CapA family protein [Ruegeria sp. TM1040]|jgi:poly-gamma-glutamate synthesis protein (capsule biosynthesis protein)|uniref:CapA family protein n=1 Tax=Rhodobacterales TaxID=204455 RepID=UPI0000462B9C|nr:CapA family protein [Ruegeria sp. TM1040]ABF62091.1 Putative enzyme of poly-gamma-glutamate biosynthesis (capsule formation)-like protein [Ruegeria sp. TM1040]
MTTLALTGDSILQRRLLSTSDPVIKPLFDLIRGCDAAFTNLEVLPNDYRGDPAFDSGGSHFGAPSWVLDDLVEAGFGMFSTATNHTLDYSISGLEYGLDQLDKRGLCHAGAGRHLEEARRAAYLTTPNAAIGMVACGSTYTKGQEAARQTAAMQGRPGLNPLWPDSTYEVTAEQMAVVKEMAEGLGLEKFRQIRISTGFAFEAPEGIFPFNGMNFRVGEQTRHVRHPNPKDLAAIIRWVEEAKLASDIALVSIHAHEHADEKDQPADFIVEFAHAVIDAGADLVVGHGPHLLRGMEIYKGKPIFYSLGNFIGQNEMVRQLPGESYDRFHVDDRLTPTQLYKQRTLDDQKGFPSDERYWQTVVPICHFEGDGLVDVEIHPVSLGLGEQRHRRGRPRLAHGAEAESILNRFSSLSYEFGSTLEVGDTCANAVL